MNQIHRIAAVAVASGVAVASLGLPSAAAKSKPPTTKSPAAAAAGYLARQLLGTHHDHYTSSYPSGKKTITYINYGESADAVLSMDAAGVAKKAAGRATAYLQKHVKAYAGGSKANYSPGALGKLMLVVEAQHLEVHSFGGHDLVAAIKATEGVRGAAAGEYQQNPKGTPAKYDYYSTASEALAVLALANSPHTGSQPDPSAAAFLAGQQCHNGGYPTQLLSDPAKACKAGADVDSTGYAVQALLAIGSHHAAANGLAWLINAEHSNGGFGKPANANSTALAIQALIAGHRSIAKPAAWLVDHQVGCSGPAGHRGAVVSQKAYDASALLATSQAGAALAGKPLAWIDRSGTTGPAPVLSCPKKK